MQPDEDPRVWPNIRDEDGGAVAPWLTVAVLDPNAVLQYVVYHTSEREVLAGGRKLGDYNGTNNPAPRHAACVHGRRRRGHRSPTDDVALKVQAKADGNVTTQDLWLMETGRFTGRYEGYLRLTDPDGDGGGENVQTDWGLQLTDATGPGKTDVEVAVLGVQSGPVVIEYQDTDGKSRTLPITIDTVPPTVQIDLPAHDSRGRDTTPAFAGAYSDADSGLREDSFRLYVDNFNDKNESGGDDDGTTPWRWISLSTSG